MRIARMSRHPERSKGGAQRHGAKSKDHFPDTAFASAIDISWRADGFNVSRAYARLSFSSVSTATMNVVVRLRSALTRSTPLTMTFLARRIPLTMTPLASRTAHPWVCGVSGRAAYRF